jgi:hypothetical protein
MKTCGCYLLEDDGYIQFCPLHSAAPDLLAALEWAVKHVRMPFYTVPSGADGFAAEWNTARAAIRKAKGE